MWNNGTKTFLFTSNEMEIETLTYITFSPFHNFANALLNYVKRNTTRAAVNNSRYFAYSPAADGCPVGVLSFPDSGVTDVHSWA